MLYVICALLLCYSSRIFCQDELAGAKVAVEQYIAKLFVHPAYPHVVTVKFDIENAEDLKSAVVLEPFINYWADLFVILRVADGKHFITECEVKEVIVPVQVGDWVRGYVFAYRDEDSELGWKAGGGSKNSPEKVYFKVYKKRANNPKNEYHLLTIIIDAYYSYILAKENGIIKLIPMHERPAQMIGSETKEDGSFRSVPLSQALPLLKQKSKERKQWIESRKSRRIYMD